MCVLWRTQMQLKLVKEKRVSEGRRAWRLYKRRPAPENNNPSTITMVTTVPP